MVVRHNDRRRIFPHGGAHHLGRPHRAAVDRANVDSAPRHHLVAGIQQQRHQVFLRQQRHLGGQQVGGVLRAGNAGPLLRRQGCNAPPQLQGGHNGAGFGVANPVLAVKLRVLRPRQPSQPVKLGDDTQRLADGILPRNAAAEQDGHQLRIVQIPRPMLPQPFPGPLRRRQLQDGRLIAYRRRRLVASLRRRRAVVKIGSRADGGRGRRHIRRRRIIGKRRFPGQHPRQQVLELLKSGHLGRRAGKHHSAPQYYIMLASLV